MFIDLESWYQLATQRTGQFGRLAAEEGGDWSCVGSIGTNPSFDTALLTLGQWQSFLVFVLIGAHVVGGKAYCSINSSFSLHLLSKVMRGFR